MRLRSVGNDEREQTLNQLLTELDGFDSDKVSQGAWPGCLWLQLLSIFFALQASTLTYALLPHASSKAWQYTCMWRHEALCQTFEAFWKRMDDLVLCLIAVPAGQRCDLHSSHQQARCAGPGTSAPWPL
jgi:hypothetical protein